MKTLQVISDNQSVAHKISELLHSIKKEDFFSGIKYVCICYRTEDGEKNRTWFDSIAALKETGMDVDESVSSIEIEFLHTPYIYNINPFNKNELNNLRGLRGISFQYMGKALKYSALQILANNRSLNSTVLKYLEKKIDQIKNIPKSIEVHLYHTSQYLITKSGADLAVISLFRGSSVYSVERVNKHALMGSMRSMSSWMLNQVQEDGRCFYKYWPSKNAYSDANNSIRQFMATICLNRIARKFSNPRIKALAHKNLLHNLETMYREKNGLGYIYLDGSAKLGAIALAALAITESPYVDELKNELNALDRCITHLTNEDGSFNTFLMPSSRTDNQNFYSGEALLYLATKYSITKSEELLNSILKSFHYYKGWHLNNRNPAFVPWHTQAYYLVWKETKLEVVKDFIFEMNDWLLSMQQWDSAAFPDMKGRFYDPERSYYGPPHASSTGVYLEGLIDAYKLAKEIGDEGRVKAYRTVILRGMRSIMQLTYRDKIDGFYVQDSMKVLGGVRTTVYDNTIRIDNVQHPLMAFFKINESFYRDDFCGRAIDD